jgi:hypothetical protein
MRSLARLTSFACVLAIGMLMGGAADAAPAAKKDTAAAAKKEPATKKDPKAAAAGAKAKIDQYTVARRAYEAEAEVYWQSVIDKRRLRNAKRARGEPIELDDYVLTQPPLYTGPGRPPGARPIGPRRPPIPVLADFLRNAAGEHNFVPQRPDEMEFKRAYVKVATAAGLTQDQIVRIYAFETGGNGTYDVQAGLTHRTKKSRAISPAMGYNQLLTTNTIGLLAEHGDRFVELLRQKADTLEGAAKAAMEKKIAGARRMIAFTRTVPYQWVEHDKLAKTTRGGIGVHAAVLDIDLGPLLQTQKLLDSVVFARTKGHTATLTAAELEMMNFTGDGNGFDLVTMPQAFREQVPTSNFFQRGGYERNPIARRTGTVAALYAAIDRRMDRGSQEQGARDLADLF